MYHFKMKKNKKIKIKKIAFIQDWGTYVNETVITCNMSFDEILVWMSKNKLISEAIERFSKDREMVEDQMNKGSTVLWHREGYSVLIFKEFIDKWSFYETLIHEICHLIYIIMQKNKLMSDETEACAYQTEYLFRNIRRNFQKIYGII